MTYRFGRGARSPHLLRRPSGVVAGGAAAPDYLISYAGGNPVSTPETVASAGVDSRFYTDGFSVETTPAFASSGTTKHTIFGVAIATDYIQKDSIAERYKIEIGNSVAVIVLTNGHGIGDTVRHDVDFVAQTWSVFVNGVEDPASPVAIAAGGWPSNDVHVAEDAAAGAPFSGDVYQPIAL